MDPVTDGGIKKNFKLCDDFKTAGGDTDYDAMLKANPPGMKWKEPDFNAILEDPDLAPGGKPMPTEEFDRKIRQVACPAPAR